MVPTRVQATPHVRSSGSTTAVLTFGASPTIGNAIIAATSLYSSGFTGSVTAADNFGNTYTLAILQVNTPEAVAILFCSKILATGPSFAVTITHPAVPGTSYWEAGAIEVGNVGNGLALDQTKGTTGTGQPSTGATAAITGPDVILAAVTANQTTQTAITVQAVTPPWVQEYENLDFSATVAAEWDTRIVTGVAGSVQSCAWTVSAANAYAAAIAVFRSTASAPTATTSTATAVTPTGATLNGTVNPNGFATAAAFEWGLTTAYGNTTADQAIGAGGSPVAITAAITGLAPSTVYHVRVKATNAGGTTYGVDQTFGTASLPTGWRLTINGTDRTAIVDACSASWALNDRGRASVVVADFLPTRYQEVISYAADGVTPLFGGVILQRDFTGRTQADGSFTVSLDCGDWFTYGDWCLATVTYAEPVTLRQVLSGLVADHLAAYGITLDPAQPDGPVLDPFPWVDKRVSDCLRDLSDRTGYVARISPGKVLSMFVPGTVPSPFTISEAATNCHDLTWRDSDRTPYNAVVVTAGPGGISEVDEERHNGDGSRRRWPLFAPFSLIVGGLITGSDATGNDPGGYNVGIYGEDDLPWTVDLATNEVVQRGDQPVRADGEYFLIWYNAVFPFTVRADLGVTPVIEINIRREDIRSIPVAQAIADQKLAGYHAAPRELRIATDLDGLEPGQALAIDLPVTRAFSGSCLVTSVALTIVLDTDQGDRFWQYAVEAIESEIYQGNYLDAWRRIAGLGDGNPGSIVGGGGGDTGGGGSSGGGGPASPIYLGGSRQFSIEPSPAAWLPFVDYVPFVAAATFNGRFRGDCYTRRAGVSVQVRIFNVSDGTVAALGPVVTSTTAIPITIDVGIVAGKTYRPEIISTVDGEGVFGIGSLETV